MALLMFAVLALLAVSTAAPNSKGTKALKKPDPYFSIACPDNPDDCGWRVELCFKEMQISEPYQDFTESYTENFDICRHQINGVGSGFPSKNFDTVVACTLKNIGMITKDNEMNTEMVATIVGSMITNSTQEIQDAVLKAIRTCRLNDVEVLDDYHGCVMSACTPRILN